MYILYCIGLDVDKKTISYCVKGCGRPGAPGRRSWSDTLGTGQLDEDASSAMDRGDGSNDFHRLDQRSSPADLEAFMDTFVMALLPSIVKQLFACNIGPVKNWFLLVPHGAFAPQFAAVSGYSHFV